jgi:hypothetical protein
MARRKRNSTVLETARQRLVGLKSITPVPDFGPSLAITGYESEITGFNALLDNYNQKVVLLDDLQNQLQAAEDALHEKNKRILSAVEGQFGSDSSQYELVGGTRLSERKRATKKAQPTS